MGLRLQNQLTGILDLDRLGMPKNMLERFRRLIHQPTGMVLVTGPTGSGKTTTLYGALKELNRPEYKILTVEDPVEYRLPGINQVQVNPKIELTFARVLRSMLRQDPDIILVGEMRDQETAEIGLRASMTGHMGLSTLPTNDAVPSAPRLLDMDAEAGDKTDALQFRRGRGCSHCNGSGYLGRIGVFEYLEMDDALVEAMHSGDPMKFAAVAKKQPGFQPLRRSAIVLAAQGQTSMEQVVRATYGVEE